MADFLDTMRQVSRARAEAARPLRQELLARACDAAGIRGLELDQFGLIAEIKPVSPAEGAFDDAVDPVDRALGYARGGAAALSVLTEESRFGGSLDLLAGIAAATELPVLRKDFLVDPVQVLEARARGASGVLLIAELLEDGELEAMLDGAGELGMFVLLEAFSLAQLRRILPRCDGRSVLAGVNCRDLRSLELDLDRFEEAAPLLGGTNWVAESGVRSIDDLDRVARTGCRLLLCGSALMRSADPAATIREFTARGRSLQCG